MPTLLFQLVTLVADLLVFTFAVYYFFRIRKREHELEKREGKIDTQYHQVVDNALTREREILEDATEEADEIIKDATYITGASKEAVNQALANITAQIQNQTLNTSNEFMGSYSESLRQLVNESLTHFKTITSQLEADLQKEIIEFSKTRLPNLEKELEQYKASRLKAIDQAVTRIIQKASQEIFNKSIPLEDHQDLVIESLEKAKQQGVFE